MARDSSDVPTSASYRPEPVSPDTDRRRRYVLLVVTVVFFAFVVIATLGPAL